MKALPPIERLNELFSYDSSNGLVTRKCDIGKRAKGCKAGDIVGSYNDGHLRVFIDGSPYQLHRIVWLMHTGNDPFPYEIDHINRIRDDNRIDNLRLVTTQDNLKNKSLYSTNKSGYPGVLKRGKRYTAQYKHNGVKHYIGTFDSALDAYEAIVKAKANTCI